MLAGSFGLRFNENVINFALIREGEEEEDNSVNVSIDHLNWVDYVRKCVYHIDSCNVSDDAYHTIRQNLFLDLPTPYEIIQNKNTMNSSLKIKSIKCK